MFIRGKWNKNIYKVMRLIGSGNFGRVYKIQDLKGNIRAIKISKDILSITNEYTAMVKLKDMSFVPKVYDMDDWEYKKEIYHFIVMDYIDGKNLRDINIYKKLDDKTIFRIGQILVNILKEIDKLGYKYTDIKLENIMINKSNNVYFIDWGSLVEKNKPTKEYTPSYNINSWNVKFDYTYEVSILFSITMIMVNLLAVEEYNPLIYDIKQVMDKIEDFPIKRDWKLFLIDGLKGRYKTFSQYAIFLGLLLEDNKSYNNLSKIDYLLIMSIVSFVFVIIIGIISIF